MKLTRRDLSTLALGTALGVQAAPAAAFFHNRMSPESIAKRLTRDLNAALSGDCPGTFSVVNVIAEDVPFWTIDAAVQLNWPPGTRRRLFLGVGDDGDEAYDKLLANAQAYFGEVLAPGNGAACFA